MHARNYFSSVAAAAIISLKLSERISVQLLTKLFSDFEMTRVLKQKREYLLHVKGEVTEDFLTFQTVVIGICSYESLSFYLQV